MVSRCRGCNLSLTSTVTGNLCNICRSYAEGRMPLVKKAVLRVSKSFTFGRFLRFPDLLTEAAHRSILFVSIVVLTSLFLSWTSNSFLINIPVAIILSAAIRRLTLELDIQLKRKPAIQLFSLQGTAKQLLPSDSLLAPPKSRSVADRTWREAIDSPLLESALEELIQLIIRDFVVDMFYSSMTSDNDAPEELRIMLLSMLGELVSRLKRVNLVNFFTRDIVELLTLHLDLYRRMRDVVGERVLELLPASEKELRLKQALLEAGELHSACLSEESEYRVLSKLSGGIILKLSRPQDAKCGFVRLFSREILASCVLKPAMAMASPKFMNKILLQAMAAVPPHPHETNQRITRSHSDSNLEFHVMKLEQSKAEAKKAPTDAKSAMPVKQSSLDDSQPSSSKKPDWATAMEKKKSATMSALAPEHLESVWTLGRRYKEKEEIAAPMNLSVIEDSEDMWSKGRKFREKESRLSTRVTHGARSAAPLKPKKEIKWVGCSRKDGDMASQSDSEGVSSLDSVTLSALRDKYVAESSELAALQDESAGLDDASDAGDGSGRGLVTESAMESDVRMEPAKKTVAGTKMAAGINVVPPPIPQPGLLQARVVGAFLAESRLGTTFVVYSVAVVDEDCSSWTIQRRYSSFELLHKSLRNLPSYLLKLPPKNYLSSKMNRQFVLQRRAQLDEYLQDILSIPTLAEHAELWDFLSPNSKRYGSTNTNQAAESVEMDGQFNATWQPLKPSSSFKPPLASAHLRLSESYKLGIHSDMPATPRSSQPQVDSAENAIHEAGSGQSSQSVEALLQGIADDNTIEEEVSDSVVPEQDPNSALQIVPEVESEENEANKEAMADSIDVNEKSVASSEELDDDESIPFEWSLSNLTLPFLKFVDTVFELHKKGWIRRQVMWVAGQLLQLVMGDAIDDYILSSIQWLISDEASASAVHYVINTLWPSGVFYRSSSSSKLSGTEKASSFEEKADMARNAAQVKKLFLDGAPSTLISLMGTKVYTAGAMDVYSVIQSPLFLKQLSYSILEAVVLALFPDMHALVMEGRNKV